MPLWYINRQAVKASLEVKQTARADQDVDRAIESASRTVEGELHRLFYPQLATFELRRPPGGAPVSAFRIDLQLPEQETHLFLDREVNQDLVTADSVSVDGTVIDPSKYTLLPIDGPPHNEIEFRGVSLGLVSGRPVSITGTWGYDNVTEPAGALAAAVGETGTTVDVTDSSRTDVGSLLTVDAERMSVADQALLDTGQTLAAGMTTSQAGRILQVADGSQLHVGETLQVDAERMLIVAIAGNDVTVRRAWDGSVLDTHSIGTAVFAPRRLTVERAVTGTTAATHAQGAAVTRQVYPGPVVAYCLAVAQLEHLNSVSGQQTAPAGHTFGTTLTNARDRAIAACGRGSGGFA